MNLIILKDGRYNDALHQAHLKKAGDPFETRSEYGQSLIKSSLAKSAEIVEAAAPIEPVAELQAEEVEVEPKAADHSVKAPAKKSKAKG